MSDKKKKKKKPKPLWKLGASRLILKADQVHKDRRKKREQQKIQKEIEEGVGKNNLP